jgi:hypothetical protein
MLLIAALWILTAIAVMFTPSRWGPWVLGIGFGASVLLAVPVARWWHPRAVARFKERNPGLAGHPLAGTFDCGPLSLRRRR